MGVHCVGSPRSFPAQNATVRNSYTPPTESRVTCATVQNSFNTIIEAEGRQHELRADAASDNSWSCIVAVALQLVLTPGIILRWASLVKQKMRR